MQNIAHLAPIMPVRDMAASLSFYNNIGFTTEFLWQEPPSYAVLKAGEGASIHLSLLDPKHRDRKVRSVIYIFVHDVDKMYQNCKDAGIAIEIEIADRDYQMRDFEVLDPNGHLITFGKGLDG